MKLYQLKTNIKCNNNITFMLLMLLPNISYAHATEAIAYPLGTLILLQIILPLIHFATEKLWTIFILYLFCQPVLWIFSIVLGMTLGKIFNNIGFLIGFSFIIFSPFILWYYLFKNKNKLFKD